jgi:hypothetical protein
VVVAAVVAVAKKAKAPNRDECRYDVRRGYYRDEVGDRCDYRDYHNGDACYNYAYQPHTNYTRGESRYGGREWEDQPGFYVDRDGDFVDCDLEYLDFNNFLPYYYLHPQNNRFASGCSVWGQGLVAVPMGYGGYVCAYYQVNYSYPTSYPVSWYPYSSGHWGGHWGGNSGGGDFNWGNFALGIGAGALLYHVLQ